MEPLQEAMTDIGFLVGKTVLVTGGTGSFGRTIVDRLTSTEVRRVRVFSRDEAKQEDMRQKYEKHVDFITGDVRDQESLTRAMDGADYVFHAAALKQVPNCERFPMEAVRTNVFGAENLVRAARSCGPRAVVALSTDKAVEPLNTMGLTKALMERILLSSHPPGVRMICVRYGNVVGSRGSVVPLFLKCLDAGEPLPITHPEMTRFLLTLEESVDLVLHAASEGRDGDLWVRKMPAATVETIVTACSLLRGNVGLATKKVGIRPGEKMHEVLVSADEMRKAESLDDHFVIRAGYTSGGPEYTSSSTVQLDTDQVVEMLRRAGL
jgi:UDP-N-acetylglucosamine 4,6-dehydratase/5-epimerase